MKKLFEVLNLRDPIWQALGTIIGVAALVVSTVVAYDIYRRSVQYTDLEIVKRVDFDPLRFGKAMEGRVALLVDGIAAESVVVYYYSITNIGQDPVLPDDYISPIQISVDDPWELLTVETESSTPPDLRVEWTRVTTNTFEMESVLLNPNDEIWVLLFMTGPAGIEKTREPKWNGRVVNVRSLDVQLPETAKEKSGLGIFWLGINHYGWSIYWLSLLTLSLFVIAVLLGIRYGRLTRLSASQVALLTVIMVLSFASSEIIVDILVEHDKQWWGAWLLIGAHLALLGYLAWPLIKGRIKKAAT